MISWMVAGFTAAACVVLALLPLGRGVLELRTGEVLAVLGLAAVVLLSVRLPVTLWSRGRFRAAMALAAGAMLSIAMVLWCRTHIQSFTMDSRYVSMRDGTRLAVDLYLPRGIPEKGLPTLISQTRYLRSVRSALPYSLVRSPAHGAAASITGGGFALVVVDVRGTGASEGHWPVPWSDEEIRDGAEIVDWVISQPWSDGRAGAFGVSYVGTTAEYLLANQHPAVLGAMVSFALYDAFDDIVMPGGLWLQSFNERWQSLNSALDANRPYEPAGLSPWMASTVTPVDADKQGEQLDRIVDTRDNGSLLQRLRALQGFRSSVTRDGYPLHSSHDLQARINDSGAAVLAVSGWNDGAYPDAALKRFYNGDNVKVLLGPWDHGGRQVISPCDDDGAQPIAYVDVLLDFQRTALLGNRDSLHAAAAPIRYFTMCNESGSGWREARTWPPASVVMQSLEVGADGSLRSGEAPGGQRSYAVDYTASRGDASRWYSYVNIDGREIGYPDLADRDSSLLLYESPPLEESLTITGNPLLNLRMAVEDGKDAAVFAYLEDVGPGEDVRYITEAQLRAGFSRIASPDEQLYRDTGPHRLFSPEHYAPLVPGEFVNLDIGFLPVSYTLRAGRKLRLSLSGADADSFAQPEGAASKWVIEHGGGATRLILPVEMP